MCEIAGNQELGANGEITVTKAWLPGGGEGWEGGKEGIRERERGKAGKELENTVAGWIPAEKCWSAPQLAHRRLHTLLCDPE